MKKAWIGWLVAALVVAGAVVGFIQWRKAHAPAPISYRTAKVEKRKIVGKITATGTLSATVTVQVGAQVSGRIKELHADWNTQVKKGQLVAKLDPLLFEASVQQGQANYLAAVASVQKAVASAAQADRVYVRELALQKESLASQIDVDAAATAAETAKADIAVQKASLAQAQAQLEQAKVNLSYTSIFSPIDGTVISRSVDVGQTVAASLQAPVLFTIAEDLRKMQVNTNIAEGDVGRLQAAQSATFTVDAFPGQTFRGRISQIRNAATTVSNVVTYDAVIDVDNPDLRLRPGMTASVSVTYAQRDDAIAVPNTALRFRPPPEMGVAAPPASASAGPPGPQPVASGELVADAGVAQADVDAGPRHGHASHADGGVPALASAAPDGSGAPSSRRSKGSSGPLDTRTIWLLRNGQPESLVAKLGLSDGTYTEVTSGNLNEGDDLIVDATVSGATAPAPSSSAKATPSPARGGRMF